MIASERVDCGLSYFHLLVFVDSDQCLAFLGSTANQRFLHLKSLRKSLIDVFQLLSTESGWPERRAQQVNLF